MTLPPDMPRALTFPIEKGRAICYFARSDSNEKNRAAAMTAERHGPGERSRVIPLPTRHPRAGNDNRPPDSDLRSGLPGVGDLTRFERDVESPDDYRQRMIANVLAFVVCIFLVLAGVWLTSKLAQMRKDQDCVLSGRSGCTPVEVPTRSRW